MCTISVGSSILQIPQALLASLVIDDSNILAWMVNAHTQLYIILLATEQPQRKVGVVYLKQVLNNMFLFPVGAIDRGASQSIEIVCRFAN